MVFQKEEGYFGFEGISEDEPGEAEAIWRGRKENVSPFLQAYGQQVLGAAAAEAPPPLRLGFVEDQKGVLLRGGFDLQVKNRGLVDPKVPLDIGMALPRHVEELLLHVEAVHPPEKGIAA